MLSATRAILSSSPAVCLGHWDNHHQACIRSNSQSDLCHLGPWGRLGTLMTCDGIEFGKKQQRVLKASLHEDSFHSEAQRSGQQVTRVTLLLRQPDSRHSSPGVDTDKSGELMSSKLQCSNALFSRHLRHLQGP